MTFCDYHFYRYIINALTRFEYITRRGDITVVTSRLECGQTVATATLCAHVYVHWNFMVRTTHVSVYMARCTCTRSQSPFCKSSFFKITRQRACACVSVMCTHSDYYGYFDTDIQIRRVRGRQAYHLKIPL